MKIHVEGVTLRTLRGRYKASLKGAAHMTGIDESTFRLWEEDGVELSITDAKRLAKSFHSHWSVFLLKTEVRPIDEPVNHRAGYSDNSHFSSDTMRAYEVARKLIDASIEVEGQTINPAFAAIQGLSKGGAAPAQVAGLVRKLMGIDIEEILKIKGGPYGAYNFWKHQISNLGVYVSEQDMPEKETKAFLLKDKKRAVIVVNKKDRYVYSRIFSLLHELGHLLKGEESAACQASLSATRTSPEESWCNRFASELLASDEEVLSDDISDQVRFSDDPASLIKTLSNKYKVSFTVILYKLKRYSRVTDKQHREMTAFFENILLPQLESKKDPSKEVKLGRMYYVRKDVAKASTSLSREVIGKQLNGSISYGEAARLLNTKTKYLEDIKASVGFGS